MNMGDPKGFFREPVPCLAGESSQPRRRSAMKTFRVWNRTLASLRDSLLPRLMRGEVRVK